MLMTQAAIQLCFTAVLLALNFGRYIPL